MTPSTPSPPRPVGPKEIKQLTSESTSPATMAGQGDKEAIFSRADGS